MGNIILGAILMTLGILIGVLLAFIFDILFNNRR